MDEQQAKSSLGNNSLPLLDQLIVLAKNARMIILVPALVTVLTYLVLLFLVPNKYTSVTAILPPQQNMSLSGQLLETLGGGAVPGSSAAGGMAASLLGFKSPGDLYVGMLSGNTICDRIIERFNLRELYQGKYIETVRMTLRHHAKISSDRKTGIITIEVTDTSPQRAADMANAFVEELDKLLQQMVFKEADERLAFLEKERLKVSKNLIAAEEGLKAFSEKNSIVQIDAQARGKLEYVARLRAEVDAKEVQLRVLRQRATSFNPETISLETEVKGLKDTLKAAEINYSQEYIGDAWLETSKVPAIGLEYIRLYREVKFQEGLFQLYNKMTELARLDRVRDLSVIQEVDRGIPPEKKSNPRLVPTMLAGGIAFIVMVFFAFIRENYQEVKTRGDVTQRLAILADYSRPLVTIWEKLRAAIKQKKGPTKFLE